LAPAAQNLGAGLWQPFQEKACGVMPGAMARIAASQPNEAIALIASRSPVVPMVNNKYHSIKARFFGVDSKLFSKVQIDSKNGLGSKEVSMPRTNHQLPPNTTILRSA
jgi:hypothetical protein